MMEIQDVGVTRMGRRNNGYIFVEKKKRGPGLGCLVLILLLVAAVVGAGMLINTGFNRRITMENASVNIMGLDKGYEGFTILHISDLHASPIGSDLTLWKDLLNGKNYKAVIITGDMVGKSGEYEPFLSLIHNLKQISDSIPIYFIAGDEDPNPVLTTNRGTPQVLAKWVLAAQEQGAIYLDSPQLLEVGKKKVWLTPQYLYDVDAEGMLTTVTERTHIIPSMDGPLMTEDMQTYTRLSEDTVVSMNMWAFPAAIMQAIKDGFPEFLSEDVPKNPEKAEYFLPKVVDNQLNAGKAQVSVLTTPDKWYGVTYAADKKDVVDALSRMSAEGAYPAPLWG